MSRAEGIVRAFSPLGEAADAVPLTVVAEEFPPPREDFVGISLMAYVENEFVLRGVINVMQGHDEFHGPQAGSQMPGIHSAAFHHIRTNLLTQLPQLPAVKFPEVFRTVDGLQ